VLGEVRVAVAEGLAQGRFRPGLADPDLIAQALWASVHGVVSLHVAKSDDDWLEWRPAMDTARVVVDATLRGLLKDDA